MRICQDAMLWKAGGADIYCWLLLLLLLMFHCSVNNEHVRKHCSNNTTVKYDIFLKILYNNKKRLYLYSIVIGEEEVDCLFVMYLAAVVADDTS